MLRHDTTSQNAPALSSKLRVRGSNPFRRANLQPPMGAGVTRGKQAAALAVLFILAGCSAGTSPTAPELPEPRATAAPAPSAQPATALPEVARLDPFTAEFLEHGRVNVTNHTGQPAYMAVRWEQQTADGWQTFDVRQAVILPEVPAHYAPRCWPPGVNRVTVLGTGLWNVEPYLPHEPGAAPPLGCTAYQK